MKTLLALLFVALMPMQAYAAEPQSSGSSVHMLGWGARSCGAWNEAKYAKDATSYGGAGSWVIGFISASNIWAPRDVLQGTDEFALISWVDNYCATHPLESIGTAAALLAIDLAKRQQSADTVGRQ